MERMKLEFDKCKLESEVTEDSLQDKLETICMTANTVVNQSVFHFFKVLDLYSQTPKNYRSHEIHIIKYFNFKEMKNTLIHNCIGSHTNCFKFIL